MRRPAPLFMDQCTTSTITAFVSIRETPRWVWGLASLTFFALLVLTTGVLLLLRSHFGLFEV